MLKAGILEAIDVTLSPFVTGSRNESQHIRSVEMTINRKCDEHTSKHIHRRFQSEARPYDTNCESKELGAGIILFLVSLSPLCPVRIGCLVKTPFLAISPFPSEDLVSACSCYYTLPVRVLLLVIADEHNGHSKNPGV